MTFPLSLRTVQTEEQHCPTRECAAQACLSVLSYSGLVCTRFATVPPTVLGLELQSV